MVLGLVTLGPVLLRDMRAGLQELSQQYCEVTLSLGFFWLSLHTVILL